MGQHVKEFSGAPDSAPDIVGQQAVDTTNKQPYIAVGTSGASDWLNVGLAGENVRVSGGRLQILNEDTAEWEDLRCRNNPDGIKELFLGD